MTWLPILGSALCRESFLRAFLSESGARGGSWSPMSAMTMHPMGRGPSKPRAARDALLLVLAAREVSAPSLVEEEYVRVSIGAYTSRSLCVLPSSHARDALLLVLAAREMSGRPSLPPRNTRTLPLAPRPSCPPTTLWFQRIP
jgi:hypothetical protein